jgi:hypothetical protein
MSQLLFSDEQRKEHRAGGHNNREEEGDLQSILVRTYDNRLGMGIQLVQIVEVFSHASYNLFAKWLRKV